MNYPTILNKAIFPLATKLMRRNFWTYYQDLQKSQWLLPEQIEQIQLQKLKTLVHHAYENVPLYRKLMNKNKVHPNDIQTIADLKKMPILTKQDFREGFPNLCTAKNSLRKNWIFDSTSGSTGSPFQFIRDTTFSDFALANTYRNYTWTGMQIGDKIASLWGYHRQSTPVKLLDFLLRRTFLSSFDIENNAQHYYQKLLTLKPHLIEAYAQSLVHFAKLLKEQGHSLQIPAAICSAENLYPHNRKLISEVFHTEVFNRYGSRELGNVAHECSEHDGLHINSESYIVEIVQEKDSEHGRLIVTNLTNFTMPFIRYDTQDLATPSTKKCPCGRGLPLLASIDGRAADFIKLPNGKELSFLFFNYFFEQYGAFITQFQVIQDQTDHLLMKLIVTKQYNAKTEQEIIFGIKQKTGMQITIEIVSKIPLEPSGKTRPVKRII